MNITLEELRAGLTLATGQTHRLVLKRIRALSLQLAVDFADASVVFDPDRQCGQRSALGVIAEVLKAAQGNPGLSLMIVAHSDASASSALSTMRAESMRALLYGERDNWASGAASAHTARDAQLLLKWASRDHGFASDPGALDGVIGPKTKAATHRFRSSYNFEFGGHLGKSDQFGEDDFAACFDLLDVALARTLGTDQAGLSRLRAGLRFCPEPTLGCGGAFPGGSVAVLQRIVPDKSKRARAKLASHHVTGAAQECAQLFVDTLTHSRTSGARIEAVGPGPAVTPAGDSILRLDMALAAAEHF